MRTRRHLPRPPARRPGTTLLEMLAVLVLVGVVLGMAVPRMHLAVARRSAQSAARETALILSWARHLAPTTGAGAAVGFDTAGARVHLVVAGDTIRTLHLRAVHGVALRTTRDSLAYDSRGLGHGAANLTIVMQRGAAAETLVVSRLGRLRTSSR